MRLRLGLKNIVGAIPCACDQVPSLREDPEHPLHCEKYTGLWKSRHDSVKQTLADIATQCGASVSIEPDQLYSDGKTPDLLIHMGARSIAVDVTVKHTLAPSYVSNLAQTALRVAREGERVKIFKYEAESKAMGMEFTPFSIETLGGWGPAAQRLVKELADHAARHTSYSKTEALRHLVQGIALAVQRGNAFLLKSAYQRSADRHNAQLRVH